MPKDIELISQLNPPYFPLALGDFEFTFNSLIDRFAQWLDSENGFYLCARSLPRTGNINYIIFKFNPSYKPYLSYEVGTDSKQIAIMLPQGLNEVERAYPVDYSRIRDELIDSFNCCMLTTFADKLRRRELLIAEKNKPGNIPLKKSSLKTA